MEDKNIGNPVIDVFRLRLYSSELSKECGPGRETKLLRGRDLYFPMRYILWILTSLLRFPV